MSSNQTLFHSNFSVIVDQKIMTKTLDQVDLICGVTTSDGVLPRKFFHKINDLFRWRIGFEAAFVFRVCQTVVNTSMDEHRYTDG